MKDIADALKKMAEVIEILCDRMLSHSRRISQLENTVSQLKAKHD